MRFLVPCLILALPAAFLTPPAAARECRAVDDLFPASTTGQCAKAFFGVINNPRTDTVRAFESTWASKSRLAKTSVEQRTSSLAELHQHLGLLTVSKVEAADPFTAFASSASGEELAFQFIMSAAESGKLESVQIMPAAEAVSPPLTPDLIKSTVEGVAREIREGYVFPEIGTKMADSILAKLKAGDYEKFSSEQALALKLTEDCRAISNDKHFGVRPSTKEAPASHLPDRTDPRRDNFGFRRVELFPGNIGYLRFDMFFEGKEACEVASSAMNFLAGADAIIFDLRSNGGGSPEMIRYITSYLFDSRTHLNDMVDRQSKVVEEYWTLENVPGRRPRTGVPVYVLTSARTFSGAEEFSYNLQNLDRATIVGETTGGGAHPVRGERVNDHFMVRIPFMRAQNPITHTNWEGTGVEPDVKTPADSALDKALELARNAAKKDLSTR